jgi:outer membrane protein
MKKTDLVAALIALFTVSVHADTVGLYVGGQIWQSDASGTFGEQNTLIDFNLNKEQQSNYFVAVEHPFSLLPNVRISRTTIDTVGKTNLTQEFSFDDVNFLMDEDVNASFNVNYVDYTLYYELFDNGLFSFDFGLTARDFDGAVTVKGTTEIVTTIVEEVYPGYDHITVETSASVIPSGEIKTDEIVPMVYVATNISFRLTGVSLFAKGDFLLIDDHSMYDYQVGLNYNLVNNMMINLNMTLGYRAVKLEFEDLDNLYSDLEFKGVFVGVIAHF